MNVVQLTELERIVTARLEAEKAKLAQLTQEEDDLQRQMADLQAQRKGLAASPRTSDEAALRAGADARWYQWVESRVVHMQQNADFLRAKRGRQLAIVKKAFGRQQVIQGLIEQAKEDDRLRVSRSVCD